MIHHFFANHGLGETLVHLHADNCYGQNNNGVLNVACTHWLASGNKNIIPPSSSYKVRTGVLAKQTFRRTKVGNLDDIANVISTSSFVNVPQLVGTLDGDYFVPTYNWSEFFEEDTKKRGLPKCSTFILKLPRLEQCL